MYTNIIEFTSVILFLGCAWHAARYQGQWFAQQWFIAGYIFALLRETVMQVAFQTPVYSATVIRLGAAPALLGLMWSAIFYLAYEFARRLVPPREAVPFAALAFVIAASFILPIEATAAQLEWWVYERPAPVLFGGVPLSAPLVWGGGGALYFVLFEQVRKSRLPDRGKMYAMVAFAPILAAVHVLYTLALSLIFG